MYILNYKNFINEAIINLPFTTVELQKFLTNNLTNVLENIYKESLKITDFEFPNVSYKTRIDDYKIDSSILTQFKDFCKSLQDFLTQFSEFSNVSVRISTNKYETGGGMLFYTKGKDVKQGETFLDDDIEYEDDSYVIGIALNRDLILKNLKSKKLIIEYLKLLASYLEHELVHYLQDFKSNFKFSQSMESGKLNIDTTTHAGIQKYYTLPQEIMSRAKDTISTLLTLNLTDTEIESFIRTKDYTKVINELALSKINSIKAVESNAAKIALEIGEIQQRLSKKYVDYSDEIFSDKDFDKVQRLGNKMMSIQDKIAKFSSNNFILLLKFSTILAYNKLFLKIYFNDSKTEQRKLNEALKLYDKYLYMYWMEYKNNRK